MQWLMIDFIKVGKNMNLTVREKKRIENITKQVLGMLPYILLIIFSIIFVLSYGSEDDILMKVIKIGLLILNIYAVYALVRKIISFINDINKKVL